MSEFGRDVLGDKTPEDVERIRKAARDLLHRDRFLDDTVFTPPAAIGHNPGEGPAFSDVPITPDDKPPHNPGATAFEVPIEI